VRADDRMLDERDTGAHLQMKAKAAGESTRNVGERFRGVRFMLRGGTLLSGGLPYLGLN
jgi:hypothetical protein